MTYKDGRLTRTKIGMTRKVQEILGLPFEVFESQQKKNLELKEDLYRAKQDARIWEEALDISSRHLVKYQTKIREMNWKQRLKFLFTGKTS